MNCYIFLCRHVNANFFDSGSSDVIVDSFYKCDFQSFDNIGDASAKEIMEVFGAKNVEELGLTERDCAAINCMNFRVRFNASEGMLGPFCVKVEDDTEFTSDMLQQLLDSKDKEELRDFLWSAKLVANPTTNRTKWIK